MFVSSLVYIPNTVHFLHGILPARYVFSAECFRCSRISVWCVMSHNFSSCTGRLSALVACLYRLRPYTGRLPSRAVHLHGLHTYTDGVPVWIVSLHNANPAQIVLLHRSYSCTGNKSARVVFLYGIFPCRFDPNSTIHHASLYRLFTCKVYPLCHMCSRTVGLFVRCIGSMASMHLQCDADAIWKICFVTSRAACSSGQHLSRSHMLRTDCLSLLVH